MNTYLTPTAFSIATSTAAIGLFSATPSQAVEIEMFFTATIESIVDEFDGDARVGDGVEGYIYYESLTPESGAFSGNYPNAVTGFDIYILPQSGDDAVLTLSDSGLGDIFVGFDEFNIDYFFDIFTGNFSVALTEGPIFNESLVTASDELVQASENSLFGDALEAFDEPFNNSSFTLQTDYTFGNAFAVFDFIEFRVVPEPASLSLVALGGVYLLGRRR